MTERERPPRLRDQSINRLIPNMLTVMALCAGLTSMLYALQGRWEPAVIAIVAAGVLDGLDGRIARLLNGQSKFGAELDSLSDFISFGVAPALLLYQWQLSELKGFGWALTMAFAVCCALRLARFNTKLDNTDLPAWTSRFFVGVPAPAGAGLVLIPVMASFEVGPGFVDQPLLVGAIELAVALLMVSRIPTYSIKRMRVPHHHVMATLLVFGLLAAMLVSIPWITLLGVGVVYIGSMPLAIVAHRRLSAQQTVPGATGADEPQDTPVE
jgi:CDP-diacylglycerol--serine O-phosphatidyltransferase